MTLLSMNLPDPLGAGLFILLGLIGIFRLLLWDRDTKQKSGWDGRIAVHYTGQEPGEYTFYGPGLYQIPVGSEIVDIVLPNAYLGDTPIIAICQLSDAGTASSIQCPYMMHEGTWLRGMEHVFLPSISVPDCIGRVWRLEIVVKSSTHLKSFYLSFSLESHRAPC